VRRSGNRTRASRTKKASKVWCVPAESRGSEKTKRKLGGLSRPLARLCRDHTTGRKRRRNPQGSNRKAGQRLGKTRRGVYPCPVLMKNLASSKGERLQPGEMHGTSAIRTLESGKRQIQTEEKKRNLWERGSSKIRHEQGKTFAFVVSVKSN